MIKIGLTVFIVTFLFLACNTVESDGYYRGKL